MDEKRIIEICKEFKEVSLRMEALHQELNLEEYIRMSVIGDYACMGIGDYEMLHVNGDWWVEHRPSDDVGAWHKICDI